MSTVIVVLNGLRLLRYRPSQAVLRTPERSKEKPAGVLK
jgi:hypothetical protein